MSTQNTPERVLLAAILQTLSPKKYARVLDLVGDVRGNNIVRFGPPTDNRHRDDIIRAARRIAGARE